MESIELKDYYWIKCMEFVSRYIGCHQLPERSFFIGGYQFPLCARCTGILIGRIAAIVNILSLKRKPKTNVIILAVPLIVDGTIQKYTAYRSTNTKRIITGMAYGFSTTSWILEQLKRFWS